MSADTRTDVQRQKEIDSLWDGRAGTLRARMVAVADAQAAFALRQALIDLAAVSELLAEDLPRPRV